MCVDALRGLGEAGQVEHVALDEAEVRVLAEVRARERVAVQVVERDHLVRVDEPAGERRPDEAGAAGDQDPLAAQRHAASLAALSWTDPCSAQCSLVTPAALPRRRRRRSAGAAGGAIDLRIAYRATTRRRPQVLTLRCDPARGTVPHPAAACRKLSARSARPRSRRRHEGRVCTQICGRPDDGARHRAATSAAASGRRLSRDDGCEIARWKRVAFLLPRPPEPSARRRTRVASRGVKTVLFVGAGRHQRRAILQAREQGIRVVAVDRNPDALGLAGRRRRRGGRLHRHRRGDRGRAPPRRRRRADRLRRPRRPRRRGGDRARSACPSIGTRRRAADAQQDRDAARASQTRACRSRRSPPCARSREAPRRSKTVGLPAVLKPADSGGQRGVFRIESEDDLDRHLHAALAESAEQECILEGFVDGHRDERHRDRARRRRRGA